MSAHLLVLQAAQRLCEARAEPEFTPNEIVRALPQLNARTVRTHVISRCCVNAAKHHQSRYAYFRKVGRGRYRLMPDYTGRSAGGTRRRQAPGLGTPQRDSVHAVVTRGDGVYVVDCHEIAVVTQGRTLDEALSNLREAVALHLEGEDLAAMGLSGLKRILISYELPADVSAA
jgi:predicted RNase H-like HicB family nuclease